VRLQIGGRNDRPGSSTRAMLPNQALSMRSKSASETKSLARGRSFARICLWVGFDFSGWRARSNCW